MVTANHLHTYQAGQSGSHLPTSNGTASTLAAGQAPGSVNLRSLYSVALAMGLPVALWRQPRVQTTNGLIALRAPIEQPALDFRRKRPGFVMAPFVDTQAPLFMPADLTLLGDVLQVANDLPPALAAVAREVITRLHAQATAKDADSTWYAPAETSDEKCAEHSSTQTQFEQLVENATQFITTMDISKVVVSRTVRAELPVHFDPVTLFDALCAKYAHAFVSLVAIPGVGTWIGASPELLLAVDDEALRTMALASTQPRDDMQAAPESVVWGEKEIVEQRMVSEYVGNFFRNAGYPDYHEEGPRTVTAGKVYHLQSLFHVPLPEAERLALANEVLTTLHPTSAVCGMPRREALTFILEHEGYDRSFYSGYLGPVFLGERSTLYVNLRCMQVRDAHACLYVGAGITAASNPTAEWHETEIKSRTILDVLRASAEQPNAVREPESTTHRTFVPHHLQSGV